MTLTAFCKPVAQFLGAIFRLLILSHKKQTYIFFISVAIIYTPIGINVYNVNSIGGQCSCAIHGAL